MRPQKDSRIAQERMPDHKVVAKDGVIQAPTDGRLVFGVTPGIRRWLVRFEVFVLVAAFCLFVAPSAFCDVYEFIEDLGSSCKIYKWISTNDPPWPDTWSVYDKDSPWTEYCVRRFSLQDARDCGYRYGQCYDECILDFSFLVNGSSADVNRQCEASAVDTIQTEVLVRFYDPHIGKTVRAVSNIQFPDTTIHSYTSASVVASAGIVTFTTDIPGLVTATSPYTFVSAKILDGANVELFNSGAITSGRCGILNLAIPGDPPTAPSNLRPYNESDTLGSNVVLSWDASTDPDGNAVTYDVYFGSTRNPPKVMTQPGISYAAGSLAPGGVYYWYLVANDGTGYTARAPSTGVFSFTAKDRAILSAAAAESGFCSPVTIKADLKRESDGAPLNGKTVYFVIGENQGLSESGSAVTGKNCDGSSGTAGVANFCYTPAPNMVSGQVYSIKAEFKGDGDLAAVSDSTKTLSIIGISTYIIVDYSGQQVFLERSTTLGARLRSTDNNSAISGKTVVFNDNSNVVGAASTDSDGWARVNWIPVSSGLKPIAAKFETVQEYAGSTETADVIVAGADFGAVPPVPTVPMPLNGSSKVGRYNEYQQLVVDLAWQCQDSTGSLIYDVYLSRTNPPSEKLKEDCLSKSVTTGALEEGVTYYWKVVPYNGIYAPIEPVPVWSFTAGAVRSSNIYYVSPSGNDNWSGSSRNYVTGTADGPWKTISKAAKAMLPGDKTVVLSGTYNEHVIIAGY